jgi:hypothetical protein
MHSRPHYDYYDYDYDYYDDYYDYDYYGCSGSGSRLA